MQLISATFLLALATAAYASPVEKRATCTVFGFTYQCSASATTAIAATTAKATSTVHASTTVHTTATASSSVASSSGGSSSGGSTEYTSGDAANDVVNNTGCTPLTVIFARGTSESGNIGTVAGPPMFKALISDLGDSGVTLQGVDYPASASGNTNEGADGGPTMASLVSQSLKQCPNSKIVLSGYSQGAMVVHNAVADQGVDASDVGAVVLFGDPENGSSVGSIPSSKVLEICATGDDVCNGSGTYTITQAHLSYGNNATEAANFIIQQTGV